MIDLTIILPSYNVGEYIDECLKSVCYETKYSIEILCIDAGSSDRTVDCIKGFLNRDSRFRLIHSEVKSYGYQVNLGISLAKGKYVQIVDTDDFVVSKTIDKLVDLAEEYNLDYIKGDYYGFVEINEKRLWRDYHMPEKISGCKILGQVIKPSSYNEIVSLDTSIWRGIYRREFISTNRIFLNETSGAAYQDVGFVLQTIECAQRAMYVDEMIYCYRQNRIESSVFNSNCLKYLMQEFDFLQKNKKNSKRIFYREVSAFLIEVKKTIISNLGNVSGVINEYSFFAEDLKKRVNNGEISKNDFADDVWKELNMILFSFEKYANKIWVDHCEIEQKKEIVLELLKQNGTVIFGCGIWGKEAVEILESNDITINAIIDNDIEMWGKDIMGYVIDNPETIIPSFLNSLYLIANKNNSLDIKLQLMQLGVLDSNIVDFWR